MMIWIIENRGRTMLKVMEKLANLSYNKQQGQQTLLTQHLTGRSHETMETKKKHTNIFYTEEKWWVKLFNTSHITRLYASLATQHCRPTLIFYCSPNYSQITV